MKRPRHIAIALLLVAAAPLAAAQSAKEQAAATARCEREVREYVEAMKFIRGAAGAQIGDRVAAGYIDEGALRKVQGEQGSCAAAQMIRERVARRG